MYRYVYKKWCVLLFRFCFVSVDGNAITFHKTPKSNENCKKMPGPNETPRTMNIGKPSNRQHAKHTHLMANLHT